MQVKVTVHHTPVDPKPSGSASPQANGKRMSEVTIAVCIGGTVFPDPMNAPP
jgi:hypothetical protein